MIVRSTYLSSKVDVPENMTNAKELIKELINGKLSSQNLGKEMRLFHMHK